MWETREFLSSLMSPRESAFYEIAKCFGLLIVITEIMAKRSVNSSSEECFKFECLEAIKRLDAS
jgi:hypothetical protein